MLDSCSRIRRRHTTINLARWLPALALLFFVSPLPASADSAPDWLRAAAQDKLPDYPDNPVAVLLFSERQTVVQPNGQIEMRVREAYRLLRPEARESYGYASVTFDGETKVTSFKAWTITSAGHEMALGEKDSIETTLSTYEVFTDIRAKVLKFSATDPGNVVGFEYTQKGRPFIFEDHWGFQSSIPTRKARLILQLPAGWEPSAFWFNYPEQKPVVSSPVNQYVWEVSDIPALDREPDMPPHTAVAGWVGLKYFPTDAAQRAKTSGSWNDIGVWFNGLAQPSRATNPAIQQKVAELTTGLSAPLPKMQALAAYVQRQIRYAEISVGIGGYQPHAAGDIFAHQYGDCKDKATLLATMLQQIGVDSYIVLVNTDRGVVRSDYPSMRFNHAILAIRVPDGVDAGGLFSTIDDPKLGTLLFFDPTNEYVPFGYLPWYLQANHALVVSPGGGELVATPLLPPSTNRLLRTAKLSLSPAGDLMGEVQELEWGSIGSTERQIFLETPANKRAELIERSLGSSMNDFNLMGASLGNLEKYDQNLTINFKFISHSYASPSGDQLLLRPRVMGDKDTYLLDLFTERKPRKYPVEFRAATRQDDLFDITLPSGYVVDGLPEPVDVKSDFATYHSETKVEGQVLHYKRTFEIQKVIVTTENLAGMRKFFQAVAGDQESTILLRKSATPNP